MSKKLTKKQKKFWRKHERLHTLLSLDTTGFLVPPHISNRVVLRDPEASFAPAFWMDSFNDRIEAQTMKAIHDMLMSQPTLPTEVTDEEMERLTDEPPTTSPGNPEAADFAAYVSRAYNIYRTTCDEGWQAFRRALDEDVPDLAVEAIDGDASPLPVNDFTPRHQQMMKSYAVYKSIKDAALKELDVVWEECYGHRYPRY